MNKTKRRTIEGSIDKASNQLQSAREHLKACRYSEAIEAAQECVELSVKAILSLLNIQYSHIHEWAPDKKDFGGLARQIQEQQLPEKLSEQYLDHIRLPRLLFLTNFWAQFYITAKYGFEAEHLASAIDLFKKEEAELAVLHADECYRAVSELRYLDQDKLAALIS